MDYHFPFWWWWLWVQQEKKGSPAPSPTPSPAPQGIFRWLHQEPDIAALSAAALETAKLGAWSKLDKKTRTRQFRALVLLSLRVAPLSSAPVSLGQLGPHLYSTADRNAAGSAIARTLVLLAPSSLRATSDILSEKEQPAQGLFETGLIPVVTVLLVSACAIAAAYLGSVVAQAVHAIHFDNEITKRLLAAHARAIEILSMHVERERIAGRELPFDDTERAWLLGLEDIQRQLATMRSQPLATPFQGATEFVRATASFLPIALIAAALFFFVKQQPERRS